jgi:hypothetical protein
MAITDSWAAPRTLSVPSAVVRWAVALSRARATPQPEARRLGFQPVRVREAIATEAKL